MSNVTTMGSGLSIRPTSQRNIVRFLGVGISLLVGAIFPYFKVLAHPMTFYIGTNQDPSQFMWYIGNFWRAVFHGQNPLYSSQFASPAGIHLAINTSVLTDALIFGPLNVSVNPVFAYNVAYFSSLILVGITMYWLLRQLGVHVGIAVLGGVLAEFCPFITNQSVDGHINFITGVGLSLLTVALLWRRVKNSTMSSWRDSVLLGMVLAMLLYTSLEEFLILFLFLVSAFTLLCVQRTKYRRNVIRLFAKGYLWISLILCILLAFPVLWAYFKSPSNGVSVFPDGLYRTDLANLIVPTPTQIFHFASLHLAVSQFGGGLSETDGYIGVAMFFLTIILWWLGNTKKKHLTLGWVVIAGFFYVLSMGPTLQIYGHVIRGVILPQWLFNQLPVLKNVLADRLSQVTDMILVGVDMCLLSASTLSARRSVNRLAKWGIGAVILLSWLPTVDYSTSQFPKSFAAFQTNQQLQKLLDGSTIYILTDSYWSFGSYMELFSAAYPNTKLTNAYAFPYTQYEMYPRLAVPHEQHLQSISTLSSLSSASVEHTLRAYTASLHEQYILYFPDDVARLPFAVRTGLNDLYGQPEIDDGIDVWRTDRSV